MPERTLLKEPNMSTIVKKAIQVTSPSQNRQKTDKRKAPRSAFQPGWSGNPGGRPKLTPAQKAQELELIPACRSSSAHAIAVIEKLMHHADRDPVRLAAASLIVERGWGKAVQAIEHSSKDGERIPASIQVTFASPNLLPPESQNTHEVGDDNGVQPWPTR